MLWKGNFSTMKDIDKYIAQAQKRGSVGIPSMDSAAQLNGGTRRGIERYGSLFCWSWERNIKEVETGVNVI